MVKTKFGGRRSHKVRFSPGTIITMWLEHGTCSDRCSKQEYKMDGVAPKESVPWYELWLNVSPWIALGCLHRSRQCLHVGPGYNSRWHYTRCDFWCQSSIVVRDLRNYGRHRVHGFSATYWATQKLARPLLHTRNRYELRDFHFRNTEKGLRGRSRSIFTSRSSCHQLNIGVCRDVIFSDFNRARASIIASRTGVIFWRLSSVRAFSLE